MNRKSAPPPKPIFLTINVCPLHNYSSIAVENEDCGERITPTKCCGQWKTHRKWALSENDWRRLAKLATEAAKIAKALESIDRKKGRKND